ncbi:MAG: HAMP domain-containing sensor histidine kinase, partial [Eubacteriales bacterium]|nr:HAMP domain-containing sensor histidine kinase [Eubacteriales bacterium]MDD4583473.1 HAMP domain-containing sensor histidine kinase [Eubacteriales bacterium]
NFMFIIVITVIILEFFLITSIRKNYYENLEDTLTNQIQTSIDIYVKYFADATLQENVLNNVDVFWKQATAQVEIIDIDGQVMMNSQGILADSVTGMDDVQVALQGKRGKWIGSVPYDTEKVMAVACPIVVDDKQVGVLRFIASLREVNNEIRSIAWSYLFFGGVVIIFSGLVSIILANSIVKPIKQLTLVAEQMAMGNYKVKSVQKSKDEIGKLSETLNYLASEILKKDELKNDFISSVSHELRTPLTSIKGWAITLKQGYENNMLLQDGLNIIEKESDRLTDMVSELLDFSRFVSGKTVLNREQVNVAEVLEHLRIQLTPKALREEIDFQVQHESVNPILFTDENRLKQVLINLLDNAFKFTTPGGRVSLKGISDEEQYYFYIEDNGCGIPEEELPRVKEKFYKGNSSKSQNGIGLSISDEIIKLMNGKCEIRSKVGQGTQVTITIPRETVDTK